ncbi:MAG TPA: beta-galactosidase GalA [Bacteroidota bacterium]|nr:beta-galactosidase GalA [Bacteroidota bacterium]
MRSRLLMDFGWKFHLGDAAAPDRDFDYGKGALFAKAGEGVGAIRMKFNDSLWRTVNLPHDWVVELGFVQSKDDDVMQHGFKPVGRQFPETSVGWYRKSFTLPAGDEGKRITIHFDGVFRDCTVWLNEHYIGRNLSGYSEFSFDVTDYIRYGGRNLLVVRVDASQYEGWFYEGAGIYRHVWLVETPPTHIPEYGVIVRSEISPTSASIIVQTQISNEGKAGNEVQLESSVVDASGNNAASRSSRPVRVDAWKSVLVSDTLLVNHPRLWSPDRPYLYSFVSRLRSGGSLLDSVVTPIGIRSIQFDLQKGLVLNGSPLKVKGVCCHQDHAGVGSALPDRLQYYRIERLKEMGCNAYRTSHNPPTPELLDACDRLGMLVLDENRLLGSTPELLNNFERQVKRDRNHPSVFLWSIGNEEWWVQNSETGGRIATSILRMVGEADPTRTATYAANNGNHFEGINSVIPVRGFNYMSGMDIDKYRRDHPSQFVIGTEEASTVCTRGEYADDSTRGYLIDEDVNKPSWGETAEVWWKFYDARDWLPGAFVWTGFDYRGEPTPYGWPCISSHFGIMDVCGFPKNNFYYYQSWWSDKDVLHLSPHWNWPGREGLPIEVWCESNCDRVELFLNGKSLGEKTMMKDSHLQWSVPYQPGTLLARGWRNGRMMETHWTTTGNPARIQLASDRTEVLADGEDVAVVTVSCCDAEAREVPDASNEILFDVDGPGKIIGVGNGDPSSHEPDKYLDGGYRRHLFNGKCQVIVQTVKRDGTITLRARADGLTGASVAVKVKPATPRPTVD